MRCQVRTLLLRIGAIVVIAVSTGIIINISRLQNHVRVNNRQRELQFVNVRNSTKITSPVTQTYADVRHVNNLVIIMALNNGYLDFFLNWFASYKKLNLTVPIVLIAEDKVVYDKVAKLDIDIITIIESNYTKINQTVIFQSKQFMDLTLRRHTYVLSYLLAGRDVIFSDTDTVWLKNPIPYFTGEYDIWMQYDTPEILCPGTMAVISTKETIEFFQKLTKGLAKYEYSDQPFLNDKLKKSKLRIRGLDTGLFPSGKLYFQFFTKKQKSGVAVVHNNWIRGHDKKVNRFKKFNLWFVNDYNVTIS